MQRIIFISMFVLSFSFGFSQDVQEASVEKSVFGVQTGLLGIWAHNELKLSSQVALRSEIGLAGVNTEDIVPLIGLEPRWYYNLKRRADKNKRIDGNSGNFFSIRTAYRHYDNSDVDKNHQNYFLLTGNWGIRRNIGKHFNYEAGIGIGFGLFNDNKNEIGYTTHFNFKIGYRF